MVVVRCRRGSLDRHELGPANVVYAAGGELRCTEAPGDEPLGLLSVTGSRG